MKVDRQVIERKRQLLVAIPALVRDHLGLVGGARVWWHVGVKGTVALTVTGRRRGGKPTRDEDCPSCAKYRAELQRVRELLRVRDVPTYNQAFQQGAAQMLAVGLKVDERLWELTALVQDLHRRLPFRARRRATRTTPPAVPEGTPLAEVVGAVDALAPVAPGPESPDAS